MKRNIFPNAYSYVLSLKKLHKVILCINPFQKAYIAQIRKYLYMNNVKDYIKTLKTLMFEYIPNLS